MKLSTQLVQNSSQVKIFVQVARMNKNLIEELTWTMTNFLKIASLTVIESMNYLFGYRSEVRPGGHAPVQFVQSSGVGWLDSVMKV